MNFSADMQGENQYNLWAISNASFDQATAESLASRYKDVTEGYEVEDYVPKTEEDYALIPNGSELPELMGKLHADNSQVKLKDLYGKLTLIDFWYMDCFPCIKAIPHLNELHEKYGDRGLSIVGVNPFNDNEKDLGRLPNFLEENPLDYNIIFAEREEVSPFLVQVYPSFYLLDSEGKVIHTELGFSEEIVPGLDSLIQANL
jgi:thiol-disulfide isomerase/thioredoxin